MEDGKGGGGNPNGNNRMDGEQSEYTEGMLMTPFYQKK